MSSAAKEANIRVRLARAGDAVALADLCTQLGYPSTPAELVERLESILGHPDHVVFVAELETGGVAGFLHAFSGMILETGSRAEILGLVADAAQRGQGIGRSLVTEAERWAQSKGHQMLHVRCNVLRTRAHTFYEGLGFRCSKTQKNFQKAL
jgi:GNAT superfamily N-acetyltransferase